MAIVHVNLDHTFTAPICFVVFFTYSLAHGLEAVISCCWARSYLKMASTLETGMISLANSKLALAVEESMSFNSSFRLC